MLCGGKTHTAQRARVRYVRDARLEAGWAQRMRHARARLEIIISEEVVLVVWLRPLGADAVVEGVVAIPVGSVVVIVVVVVIVRRVCSKKTTSPTCDDAGRADAGGL